MFRDDGPGMRALLGALQAPATPDELAGEEQARALFTTFLPEPVAPRRRIVHPLALVAAAAVTVSIGAMAVADGLTPSSPAGLTPAAVVEQRDGGPTSTSPRVGAVPLSTPSSGAAAPMAGDTGLTSKITPVPGPPQAPRAEHAAPSTSAPVTTGGVSIRRPPVSTPPTTRTAAPTPTTTPMSGTLTPPGNSAVPLCHAYQAEKITSPRLERLAEYAGGVSSIDPYCTALLVNDKAVTPPVAQPIWAATSSSASVSSARP